LALAAHVACEDEGAIIGGKRREGGVVELLGDVQLVVLDLEGCCAARAGSRSVLPCTMFGFQPRASPHGSQR
jgi:hypothetical protein